MMKRHLLPLFAAAALVAFPAHAQSSTPTTSTTGSETTSSEDCTGGGCTTSGDATQDTYQSNTSQNQANPAQNAGTRTDGSATEARYNTTGNGVAGADGTVSGTRSSTTTNRDGTTAPTMTQRPLPTTDFQRYVQSSTGHLLRVFGTDLFQNAGPDFLAATNAPAPADYVVGVGDQVHIHTAGSVSFDQQTTVDRNGMIYIPQVGALNVAGKRLGDLQGYVQSAVSRQFRNFDLSVTLGRLRSIQVFVLGEARSPGLHTISSLSTLVNGLFAAGGPSASGSLRDIQLKRGGQTLTHLDLYDLLLNGSKENDQPLRDGDIIFIPVIGPQAAVDGDVNKPAIYELRNGTSVDDLLRLAGGLTPVAATDRASLDRIVDHASRTVQDFPLTGAQKLIPAQGGDVLRVFPISPRFDKAVTLRGNVGEPGRYPWHPGMRVSDLIPSRQFLITRRYYNQQNALTPPVPYRPFATSANADNTALTSQATSTQATITQNNTQGTSTQSTTRSQDVAAAEASGAGAFVLPENVEFGNHDTEINWNYAVIERLDPKDLRSDLVSFALGEAIDTPTSPENKLLQPGDVITVYSRTDINLPTELRARFVRVDGEVVRPGIYRISGEETLRDVVARAGGVSPHGYLYAAQFTRESVRIAGDAKLQALVLQAKRSVLSPANQQIGTDGRTNTGDLDLRRAYVDALSQVRATGRITLQIPPRADGLNDIPAFALQDGDRFFIPPRPNTVDVLGSVFNAGALLYTSDAPLKHYLKMAGDRTREGDKGQEYLLRADGTVLSRENHARFDSLKVFPGDTIIVPAHLKSGINLYQLLSITQSLSSVALTAVAFGALNK